MIDPLADIIDRPEKIGIRSAAPSTVVARGTGPYDPPILAPTLNSQISEICAKLDVEEEGTSKLSSKLPQVELQKFSGQDFHCDFVDLWFTSLDKPVNFHLVI